MNKIEKDTENVCKNKNMNITSRDPNSVCQKCEVCYVYLLLVCCYVPRERAHFYVSQCDSEGHDVLCMSALLRDSE